ncbi:MAG: 30S ribosomal protein S9 [Candidatus Komeilibacteria bacterium]
MTARTTTIITVGRRKTAVARLKVNKTDDQSFIMTVNNVDWKQYFPYAQWQENILQPMKLLGQEKLNLSVKVSGGGKSSQSEAVRHAIARALLKMDEAFKSTLRKNGLLTRDSRKKERKKPGLKRARRAPQWSKR